MNNASNKHIPSKYDPNKVEDKWYAYWMENGYFHANVDPSKKPYTIIIPPPNVTGVLHMGHMLNNTIQDVLIRRARMQGYNACWVPGTDHAAIATEAKVVRKLRDEGITKKDLTRDQFLEHAWDWTHKHGGIILEQLKKLGASCDWERTAFTLDDDYAESVIDAFIELYGDGKIYRSARMINWDPSAKTALSDEEVIYKEVNSKLYYVRYQIAESEDFLTIATTRPETILGDTAVCINPNDERYTHLHGKKAIVPLVNREIPIILDDYVDMEFGTGCLKVTPAHDVNDYELGQKHGLETINMMNADGTISEEGELYLGMDRFEVRKQISKDLESAGNLIRTEDYKNKVGYSERTDVVIEPRLSLQWWLSMKELARPALENVMNDNVEFFPKKFKNTYRHWMENVKDWCVSRQLWWGHQIPAFYYGEEEHEYVVAKSHVQALELAREKSGDPNLSSEQLKQDEDVLDTWFSSWLWPISLFDPAYIREHKNRPPNEELEYFFQRANEANGYAEDEVGNSTLVTAPEIMFFWVARMIISGYKFVGNKPFNNVYYTGIVRDKIGRKMSKSLGNSPDPIELISKYGADGVRMGMLFSTPAGNDLPFDPAICEQGKKFSNKVWNAFRFLMLNIDSEKKDEFNPNEEIRKIFSSKSTLDDINNYFYTFTDFKDQWMIGNILISIFEINNAFDEYRLNDALKKIYSLLWDDFCDWYIELIKSDDPKERISKEKISIALAFLEQLLKLLHPFMPFISEEIWGNIETRKTRDDRLIVAKWPETIDKTNINIFAAESDSRRFRLFQNIVRTIRKIRAEYLIPEKDELTVFIRTKDEIDFNLIFHHQDIIKKLQKVTLKFLDENAKKPEASASALISGNELYIPLADFIDVDKERERIQSEIKRIEGWLKGVNGKLNNQNFVNNAPDAVVENERNKKRDGEANLAKLQEQLSDFE